MDVDVGSEDGVIDGGYIGQRISVDVNGIDDFAALLRQELDANFAPTSDRIIRALPA